MEGLTVDGQMQYDRFETVNFERERKIFKLYRRTNVLQRRRALEQRIMIFWFLFLEKLYRIFVFYHAILLRSGLK